jgi:hypothetical protein
LIAAHRYIEAATIIASLTDESKWLPADRLLVVAQIAESKTSTDIQNVIEQVASPVGAWKLKRSAAFPAVNSFVGLQGGWETLTSPSTSSKSGLFYGAYVPLGIEYTWPLSNRKGYYGLYFQALDLGIRASDHANRTQAQGGSRSGISQVLAPGIGALINPGWLGPVTFGLTYVFRTPSLRTAPSSTVGSAELDSRRVMLTVGVDVTVFRLGH